MAFYRSLGFDILHEAEWRAGDFPAFAISCGDQKINVHDPKLWQNSKFTLRGPTAEPGCGDFCFVWDGTEAALEELLDGAGAEVITGPAPRTGGRDGGTAEGTSRYIRDPDDNLLEFIVY